MALITRFQIERPGFEHLVFSESTSRKWTDMDNGGIVAPDAVRFAREKGGVLPSVQEAAAFSMEAYSRDWMKEEGIYGAITRSATLYFVEGGKTYLAIDDHPDPAQNLVMRYARQGGKLNSKNTPLLLDRGEVADAIKRAERDARLHEIPDTGLNHEHVSTDDLSLCELDKPIEEYPHFTRNTYVSSFLGDITEDYARFITPRCNSAAVALNHPHKYQRGQEKGSEFSIRKLVGDQVLVSVVILDDIVGSPGIMDWHGFQHLSSARAVYNAREWSRETAPKVK
ncbi:MAG: hypothetical protein Q7S65_00135 [Nanoarchaeota archaeon]|nr:hypothetical protein [Nanoarchaeota archaeon]